MPGPAPRPPTASPGAELLARHDVALVRADNPGPYTLAGTNTWVVGRGPAWVVDPGPALASHLDALAAELERRGGLGGIVLTHDHPDHADAAVPLRERLGADAPIAAAHGPVDVHLRDGAPAGPLTTVATPGHAPDHLAFALGPIAFSGDAVLGAGSALLIPAPGALAAYLASLERLAALEPTVICPGHGPLIVDPRAKLAAYRAHRLARERRVLDALRRGRRTADELLADAWDELPDALRPAAAATLRAHLDKLADEGRLPEGVERPPWPTRLGCVRP